MEREWCDAVSPWMGKPGERRRLVCEKEVHPEGTGHSWQFPMFRGIVVMGPDEDPERVDVIDLELPDAEEHVPWPHSRDDDVTE